MQRSRMNFRKEYEELLEAIAKEADAIAMKYFRSNGMRVERKRDGTAVTEADRAVEEMARAKVAASGIALEVLGEEMGGKGRNAASAPARLIIDPIDGTEEFSRGIATFGTLLAIERDSEIVAGEGRGPRLGGGWWGLRRPGCHRQGKRGLLCSAALLVGAIV